MRPHLVMLPLASLVIVGCSTASALPPPEDAQPVTDVQTQEFPGRQLASVLAAWEALKAAHPDIAPLEMMHVSYTSNGTLTTVMFMAPPRTVVRDGRALLEFGPNFYQVSISGDQIVVIPNPVAQ